ncbi:hypothetical protein AGOR_G00082230 [Albula goreensis]|uniref:C2 domain-containing protein n=1 Tax=Albula goreensis TaxID=1534307 RepID=A0A8T3DLE3_9TELE|nr:hypothetical protein AGOR_G00082230 [Albula goreensis]
MAFFKSFQQSLPSVSSILDSVSTAVDDLASAVGDVTYTVSDQLAEQVTTLMSKVGTEEEERDGGAMEATGQVNQEHASERQSSNRCQGPEAYTKDCSKRSTRSADTPAASDHHPSPAEGGRGEGQRNRATRKVEEGRAKVNVRSDSLAEQSRSRSSPKDKSAKHRDDSDKDATSPLDNREAGGRSQNSQEEANTSPPDGVTRRGKQVPNGEATNGERQRESDRESLPPTSKSGQGKTRHLTKQDGEERAEEERSSRKVTVDAKRTDDKEKAGLCEESAKSAKEEKGTQINTNHDRKRQKDPSGKDSRKPGDGNGDYWESSSESESEKRKKQVESVCRSPARQQEAGSQSQRSYDWETQQKYSLHSAQYGGYSSEGSTEEANCIQRMSRSPQLEEQRPPPYQDEHGSPRMTRVCGRHEPSRRGAVTTRRSHAKHPSDGSDDHETKSHNKEQEEDVPSDSTAVLGQEDMSAQGSALLLSQGYEPEPLAKYGTLDVAFDYDSGEQRLAVTVTAATDIPALRRTGNVSWQVHLVLLPTKQQRAKTGVQKGPCPVFTETFKFSCVESETIGSYAVRFRLYSVRRMRKERVMGEKVFYLTKLNLQGKMTVPVTLDPGCTLTQGCGSLRSVSCSEGASSYRSAEQNSKPEILLGLLYSSTTGRLSVEVIKGSHLRNIPQDKPPTLSDGLFCCLKHLIGGQLYIIPDTYVKLSMMNSVGQEMSKCKTSTCRGQPDPTYKETFVFQVALFQLSEVTLLLSVYSRRGVKRRDRVGWVSLGLNSSGEVETSHWTQMREAEGQQVCRWHTLLES